jgi:hypothetical protein
MMNNTIVHDFSDSMKPSSIKGVGSMAKRSTSLRNKLFKE